MKINKKEVKELLKDIENNFSTLIDVIIYYDSIDQDESAMKIIDKIEEIQLDKEIDFLIEDIVKRNYTINPGFLYSSIWYYIANSESKKETLINKIANSQYRNDLIKYLNSLNSGKNKQYDLNMQTVIDSVNSK